MLTSTILIKHCLEVTFHDNSLKNHTFKVCTCIIKHNKSGVSQNRLCVIALKNTCTENTLSVRQTMWCNKEKDSFYFELFVYLSLLRNCISLSFKFSLYTEDLYLSRSMGNSYLSVPTFKLFRSCLQTCLKRSVGRSRLRLPLTNSLYIIYFGIRSLPILRIWPSQRIYKLQ